VLFVSFDEASSKPLKCYLKMRLKGFSILKTFLKALRVVRRVICIFAQEATRATPFAHRGEVGGFQRTTEQEVVPS